MFEKEGKTCNLQRAGSDVIYLSGGTSTNTSTSVSFGTALTLVSDGVSSWFVIA